MNELQLSTDSNTELAAVEHVVTLSESRVVTYNGSAAFLQVNASTLRTIFNRYGEFFTEGVDYFRVSHIEAKALNVQVNVGKFYNGRKGTVVFTETGLLKLSVKAKSGIAQEVVQKLINGFIENRTTPQTLAQQTQALNNSIAYNDSRNADAIERAASASESILEASRAARANAQ